MLSRFRSIFLTALWMGLFFACEAYAQQTGGTTTLSGLAKNQGDVKDTITLMDAIFFTAIGLSYPVAIMHLKNFVDMWRKEKDAWVHLVKAFAYGAPITVISLFTFVALGKKAPIFHLFL